MRKSFGRQICCALLLLLAQGAEAGDAPSSSFDCVIEPHQVVKLASPVVGVIAELHVDRGDVVTKGQSLGKLEDGVERAGLALAETRAQNEYSIRSIQARLEFLNKKNGRAGELLSKNIMSQAAAEEIAADTKMSEKHC